MQWHAATKRHPTAPINLPQWPTRVSFNPTKLDSLTINCCFCQIPKILWDFRALSTTAQHSFRTLGRSLAIQWKFHFSFTLKVRSFVTLWLFFPFWSVDVLSSCFGALERLLGDLVTISHQFHFESLAVYCSSAISSWAAKTSLTSNWDYLEFRDVSSFFFLFNWNLGWLLLSFGYFDSLEILWIRRHFHFFLKLTYCLSPSNSSLTFESNPNSSQLAIDNYIYQTAKRT